MLYTTTTTTTTRSIATMFSAHIINNYSIRILLPWQPLSRLKNVAFAQPRMLHLPNFAAWPSQRLLLTWLLTPSLEWAVGRPLDQSRLTVDSDWESDQGKEWDLDACPGWRDGAGCAAALRAWLGSLAAWARRLRTPSLQVANAAAVSLPMSDSPAGSHDGRPNLDP